MASPKQPPQQVVDADDTLACPGKRPAGRGRTFYPRKRANTACQVCRARKTKCDNLKPSCSYCVSVGATCIQSPTDLSSFDPASLKILERLDELESTIRNELQSRPSDTGPYSNHTQAIGVPGNGNWSGTADKDEDIALRSILPEKIESLRQWSIFHHQTFPDPSPQVPWDLAATSPGGLDIEPGGVNALLDSFFSNVHCKNPIFAEVPTRKLIMNKLIEGIDWSPESCLALLVCALGRISTSFRSNPETAPHTMVFMESNNFFQAAQKRLGSLLCHSGLIGPQCLLLSGIYMMHVHQPIYAWRLFSQALAACQHLPLLAKAVHSACATGAPGTPVESVEVSSLETRQQALYWSAWKSERELRQELLLPDFNSVATTVNLYPSFFPTPPASAEIVEGDSQENERSSWLFYLSEISLRRLFSRVSHEIIALHRNSASNAIFLHELSLLIPEYEAQVRQWADSLPPELSLSLPPRDDNVCIFVLRGHCENFYEAIYWPFLMARLNSDIVSPKLAKTVDELAGRGIEAHVQRIQINVPGFTHRHHGTWLMIRSCIRSAVVLLGVAKLQYSLPQEWDSAVWQVWRLTCDWEDEIAELREWSGFLRQMLDSCGGGQCSE